MKNLVFVSLVLFYNSLFAQSARAIEQAPQNYLMALNSKNESIVESAIFYSVKFKLFYEEQDVQKLVVKLEKLAIEGPTKVIRYKAFLAAYYLNDITLLMEIAKEDYKDANRFFQMLGEGLQEKLLADRTE
jgi:hypothetical protein